MKKIGFIGMGNMANAIVGGLTMKGFLKGEQVYAYDRSQEKLLLAKENYGLQICQDEIDVVNKADIIVFAIKPNGIESLIEKIRNHLDTKAIVSIVAGYSFEKYNTLLLPTTRHLSIMPNTPLMLGAGVSLLEQEHSLTKEEFMYIKTMFSSIGSVEVLPSSLMKAGGAISGCGPAFMYMIIEAVADGGVMEGLPRDVAYRLASQTMIGAGVMQVETKEHPGVLKDNVCSPGGITIKGVQSLEEDGIRAAFIKAIQKAK